MNVGPDRVERNHPDYCFEANTRVVFTDRYESGTNIFARLTKLGRHWPT